ncbi:hypothetical protein DFH27DRAFT_607301 [Peziza echinospora]|nr:hypothetical protein DFH27DRAFT_607301 [Peziza echinospora]
MHRATRSGSLSVLFFTLAIAAPAMVAKMTLDNIQNGRGCGGDDTPREEVGDLESFLKDLDGFIKKEAQKGRRAADRAGNMIDARQGNGGNEEGQGDGQGDGQVNNDAQDAVLGDAPVDGADNPLLGGFGED